MTEEEIRVRSIYLYLSCSQDVERYVTQVVAALPTPLPSPRILLEQVVRRELGLLIRYWIARQVWQRLDANEADAKLLNLSLLRLFIEGLRLPRDGSGLRYAELSSLADETRELHHRMVNALGVDAPSLLTTLQQSVGAWRQTTWQATAEALERPVEQLTDRVKAWAQRPTGS